MPSVLMPQSCPDNNNLKAEFIIQTKVNIWTLTHLSDSCSDSFLLPACWDLLRSIWKRPIYSWVLRRGSEVSSQMSIFCRADWLVAEDKTNLGVERISAEPQMKRKNKWNCCWCFYFENTSLPSGGGLGLCWPLHDCRHTLLISLPSQREKE